MEKIAQVDREKFTDIVLQLEQATSVARAGKFALSTDYAQGLSDEEIMNVFDAIVGLLEPIKDIMYPITECIDVRSDEKLVIK